MTNKGPRIKKIPDGDQHERLVCPECDHIAYDNPKIVNLVVATYQDKILLCRRGIPPRVGYWTLPGGFMENGETVTEGALREAFEEATARGKIGPLLAIYHTPNKANVMMIFRMEMSTAEARAGIESQEVKFFDWKDIPWNDLAFPMVERALKQYERTKGLTDFQPEIAIMPPIVPPPVAGAKPQP